MPSLPALIPVEPHGTFRWLHCAYHVRSRQDVPCPQQEEWQEFATALASRPAAPLDPQDLALLNIHAWTLARCGHARLLDHHWAQLTPAARGAALAGGSDVFHLLQLEWMNYESLHLAPSIADKFRKDAAPIIQWLHQRLSEADLLEHPAALTPENVLELACSAISVHDALLLQRVLLLGHDHLLSTVQRMQPHYDGFTWSRDSKFAEQTNRLSHRVIDMILEAALVIGHLDALTHALRAGASPHIPIWVLDRSSNEFHTTLTYALDQRDPQWVELLLQPGHGLQPGPETPSLALYLAIEKGRHKLARRLIEAGMTFHRGDTPDWLLESQPGDDLAVRRCMHFNCSTESISRAQRLGHDLPLAHPTEVAWFYQGDGQGGRYRTFLSLFLYKDNLPGLQQYTALGLPLRLTAPDLATALSWKAKHCLPWLAQQLHAPPAFMARVREEIQDFREPTETGEAS